MPVLLPLSLLWPCSTLLTLQLRLVLLVELLPRTPLVWLQHVHQMSLLQCRTPRGMPCSAPDVEHCQQHHQRLPAP